MTTGHGGDDIIVCLFLQPLVELTVQERGIYKLSESDYKRLGNLFSDIIVSSRTSAALLIMHIIIM